MESSDVVGLVGELAAADIASGSLECCTRVLHDLSRVIAWAEATKITVASRLSELAVTSPAIFPEDVVATATRGLARPSDATLQTCWSDHGDALHW
jgi:hypothetical protein